jgi:hypothetical protein
MSFSVISYYMPKSVYNKTIFLFMGSTKMCVVITRHILIGQLGSRGKKKQTVQKVPIADLTSSLRVRLWDLRRVESNGSVGEGPRSRLLFVGPVAASPFEGECAEGASYERLVL